MLQYLAYQSSPLLLVSLLFVSIVASIALGIYVGSRHALAEAPTFTVSQAAVLGLSGLILAFTFSAAATRFEERRALVVKEASAIGRAYLRADLLPPADRVAYKTLIRAYAQQRLQRYARSLSGGALDSERERSRTTQMQAWRLVARVANAEPRNIGVAFIIPSLNEAFEAGEAQEEALRDGVPGAILALVVIVTLLGAFLDGVGFASGRRHNAIASIIVAALLTMVVFTIFDLDRLQSGAIGIDLTALEQQLQDMQADAR